MKAIEIERLRITYNTKVLVDCTFRIYRSLALVGQSGSGKSLILKALLGVNEKTLDTVLQVRSDFEWVRGQSIAFVPQNPFTALSPLTKIKDQLFLPKEKGIEIFGWLGLNEELLERYPNELSGGQLQRVVIAIALSSQPSLLLLDEPTTALDTQSRSDLIELLRSLQEKFGFAILFVTHDMDVALRLCEDICVLKEGNIVEEGKMADVYHHPQHSYTAQLIEADFKHREFRQ